MKLMKFRIILFLFSGLFSVCTLLAQNNDSLSIPYYIIDSSPQNAEVFIDGIFSGQTPARIVLAEGTEKKVVIKLKGYLDYSLSISSADSPLSKNITLISK